jgi:hypothetical protein
VHPELMQTGPKKKKKKKKLNKYIEKKSGTSSWLPTRNIARCTDNITLNYMVILA